MLKGNRQYLRSNTLYSSILNFGGSKLKYKKKYMNEKKLNPSIMVGGNILSEVEELAKKKLNKHSSSLDNTDWLACHKLKKEINTKGNYYINTDRKTEVMMVEKFLKGRPTVTKAQAKIKKGSKYRLGMNTERMQNIPEGKRTVLGGGTPKAIIFHRKK